MKVLGSSSEKGGRMRVLGSSSEKGGRIRVLGLMFSVRMVECTYVCDISSVKMARVIYILSGQQIELFQLSSEWSIPLYICLLLTANFILVMVGFFLALLLHIPPKHRLVVMGMYSTRWLIMLLACIQGLALIDALFAQAQSAQCTFHYPLLLGLLRQAMLPYLQ